jgi:hypothetical protein
VTDNFPEDKSLLDKIISEIRFLTEDLQKDVLACINNIKESRSYPDLLACINNIKEPRTYPRVNKFIEMDVLIGDKVIQSNSRNMSASGVFIKSRMTPDIGTSVKIVFSLPGQAKPFKLNGTVARIDSDGIGICFSEMTPYVRNHLDNLLKRLSMGRS